MIELKDLYKSYDKGRTYVVNHVDLTIQPGETIVILGSSGCGKTTTLKMINGLIKPTSGIVKIDGEDIKEKDPVELRRSIGYVFQRVGLFPNMSVSENVAVVLKLLKFPQSKRLTRAHELLKLVGLNPNKYANRPIQALSGGQQQRIGVARALANNPNILLMDEPFGALDSITRNTMQLELIKLNEELKKTIVFVTHDIFEAFRLADRIVVMDQGTIQQVGTKHELIENPATAFVRNLINTQKRQIDFMHEVLEKD